MLKRKNSPVSLCSTARAFNITARNMRDTILPQILTQSKTYSFILIFVKYRWNSNLSFAFKKEINLISPNSFLLKREPSSFLFLSTPSVSTFPFPAEKRSHLVGNIVPDFDYVSTAKRTHARWRRRWANRTRSKSTALGWRKNVSIRHTESSGRVNTDCG